MKWLACITTLLAAQTAHAQQDPKRETLKSGEYHVTQSWSQEESFERLYHVRVPDTQDKQRRLPVLVFLHGNGGNAPEAMRGFIRGRGKIASRYILVFPQGYRESWNIVSERSKADDLRFIESIVLKLATFENVDPNNFTIMGASNGAALVNQLAIESRLPNIRNYISGVSQLNVWQMSWEVNVMSHVYAARHLIPRMIERGGGYFLNTASAAGLLNQIGSAAYGVTKHAAVGFGEWLALTYAHQGIKVSMLCPQAVRTAMTASADESEDAARRSSHQAAAADGMMEADQVADIVVEGLHQESFLILPHPEVETYMQRKKSDYDRWLKGMNRLHRSLNEAS